MQMDTSIPLSNLLRPHIQSPAESFGFEQQVKQARFEDQQRQQKMQQDQQMKQIFSNPQYLDKETGGLNTNGIIAGGRVLGPEWAGKVSHQYAQTLGSLSEQKKRLHDIDVSNKKQSATWAKTMYEEALADLTAESKSKPMSQAFSTVRQKMVDRINELFSSGEAAKMGLNEEHHQKYLQALPTDYEHLKASQTKIAELEKQLEAMQTGQPAPAPAAPEGPQIGVPKPQGEVDQTTLPETPLEKDKNNQIADVRELRKDSNKARVLSESMANEGTKALSDISVKLTGSGIGLDEVGKPAEAPKAQTPTQKRAEADKLRQSAIAQDALGNINNAKKQRDQAKLLVTEADREEHEQRLKDKPLTAQINQIDISDETATRLAGEVLGGNPAAAAGYARNQKAKVRIDEKITQVAKARNMSPEDINAALANYRGLTQGVKSAAVREANIGMVIKDIELSAPIAAKALEGVTRTGFKPVNELIRLGASKWSPEEKAFALANQQLIGQYAQVIQRGAPTVHSLQEAKELLNTADTPEQYRATMAMLQLEAKTALEAAKQFRKSILSEMSREEQKVFDPVMEYDKMIKGMRSGKDGIPKPVTPMGAGTQPPKMTATNPKTGEKIQSNDGGKTWHPLK